MRTARDLILFGCLTAAGACALGTVWPVVDASQVPDDLISTVVTRDRSLGWMLTDQGDLYTFDPKTGAVSPSVVHLSFWVPTRLTGSTQREDAAYLLMKFGIYELDASGLTFVAWPPVDERVCDISVDQDGDMYVMTQGPAGGTLHRWSAVSSTWDLSVTTWTSPDIWCGRVSVDPASDVGLIVFPGSGGVRHYTDDLWYLGNQWLEDPPGPNAYYDDDIDLLFHTVARTGWQMISPDAIVTLNHLDGPLLSSTSVPGLSSTGRHVVQLVDDTSNSTLEVWASGGDWTAQTVVSRIEVSF